MSDCIYKTAERITCYMYGFFPREMEKSLRLLLI